MSPIRLLQMLLSHVFVPPFCFVLCTTTDTNVSLCTYSCSTEENGVNESLGVLAASDLKKKRKNYESINSLVYVKSAEVTCLKTVLAEHYLNIQAIFFFYKAFHHDLG